MMNARSPQSSWERHAPLRILPAYSKHNRFSELADDLLKENIYVIGFSYPVVPKGQARIRVQLSAAHQPAQIERATSAFIKCGRARKIIS
jgi:7-keto-8-aminopelargonate synthetase-like enzyme